MEDKTYRKEMTSILEDLGDVILNLEGVTAQLEEELLDEDITDEERKVSVGRLDNLDDIRGDLNDVREKLESEEEEG